VLLFAVVSQTVGGASDVPLTLYPACLQLPLGQHITLEAQPKGKNFVWSSSDTSVATVDENGRITPIAVDEVFITVALADDAEASAICGVLVAADGNIFLWDGNEAARDPGGIVENTDLGLGEAKAAEIDYGCYKQVLLAIHEEFADDYGSSDYLEYALYDFDGDGVKELIVLAGTCEADFVWRIYTVIDSEAQYIGETFGGHSMLFACPEGGFYNMIGHMGYEEIYRVIYSFNTVFEGLISSRELADDEDYGSPGIPIRTAYITEYSLLQDASNGDM